MKLEMKNIEIEFPGVKALDKVSFQIESGKSQALIGANGAGKSTLMKVLSGVNNHYTGEIYLDGKKVEIRSPKMAKELGIAIVYQEVDIALVPYLSVAENVMFDYLANDMGKKQFINWKKIRSKAKEVLQKINVNINVDRLVSELTLAEKQMVLIARCLVQEIHFLILDEPTAPLSNSETKELFRVVNDLVKSGVGIVFISHRLNELFEICEYMTVLRDGKLVDSMPIGEDLSINQIVEMMLGRQIDDVYIKREVEFGDVILEIKNLSEKDNKVKNINMYVRKGEIVGVAGLVGAGKTELCKTLFGDYHHSGEIYVNGEIVKNATPSKAVKNGFALVPEERRKEGVLISDPVYSNISAASLSKYTRFLSIIKKLKEKADARGMIKKLGIITPSENRKVALLSGGNQQKVVVAKWLNSDASIYIYDEPTKGIDVGAKRDMYELVEQLASEGKGAIYATCEFKEILSICDRVYVMYDGEIVKELSVKETDEQELLYYSTGGK